MINRLTVCYIPGLDLRRINVENTPYITKIFNQYPWVKMKTMPTIDYLPTLLTGFYPPEHGWEVWLKSNFNHSLIKVLVRTLPDILTTAFQCFIHLFNSSFDLATVPTWRRMRFEIKRTRYLSRDVNNLVKFDEIDSIFNIIGVEKTKYITCNYIDRLGNLVKNLTVEENELEMIEIYALDTIQHWYLDDTIRIGEAYRHIDHFFENLHNELQKKGATLMLVSDHGQELVRGSINIKEKLGDLRLSNDEYTYYLETIRARFWFHSERSRERILDMLSSIGHGKVLSYKDYHQYKLNYPDNRYGEIFFLADSGYIIFPHDFYHPLANLYLGLIDKQQRNRIFNPMHRGNHHYLPHNESEIGFMMLLNEKYKAKQGESEIIDFAPTVLNLLGYEKPNFMEGLCVFAN